MPLTRLIILAPLTLLAACATMTPGSRGWNGAGAEPFDGALAECQASSAALPSDQRQAALEQCMAQKGWHRGR